MVFHGSLSDSKSPQVSRTLLSILAVLSNAVIWIVSTYSSTSKSSRPFNNPFVIVPKAPITIGIIVTFMFHSFFNSLARSRYLSFFSHSFSFILWAAETAKSTLLQILFFICSSVDIIKMMVLFKYISAFLSKIKTCSDLDRDPRVVSEDEDIKVKTLKNITKFRKVHS